MKTRTHSIANLSLVTIPSPLEPGKQPLPERGVTHRMLLKLNPDLALARIRHELLQNVFFLGPLPRPEMHGSPPHVLRPLLMLVEKEMAALVHPSHIPKAPDGGPIPPGWHPRGTEGQPSAENNEPNVCQCSSQNRK